MNVQGGETMSNADLNYQNELTGKSKGGAANFDTDAAAEQGIIPQ